MKARAAVVAAILLTAACGTGSPKGSQDPLPTGTAALVDIKEIAFNPQSVTIAAGHSVGWHFEDGAVAHNVVGDGWRSPDRTSGYYTHSFAAPGTYGYRCTIHTNMTGTVTVTA